MAKITGTVLRAGSKKYYETRIVKLKVDQIRYAEELVGLVADEAVENLKF